MVRVGGWGGFGSENGGFVWVLAILWAFQVESGHLETQFRPVQGESGHVQTESRPGQAGLDVSKPSLEVSRPNFEVSRRKFEASRNDRAAAKHDFAAAKLRSG